MATIDLGVFRQHYEGVWNTSDTYAKYSTVTHNNVLYECVSAAPATPGETPGVSAKWQALLDANAATLPAEGLIYTNAAGAAQVLPLTVDGVPRIVAGQLVVQPYNTAAPNSPRFAQMHEGAALLGNGSVMLNTQGNLVATGQFNAARTQFSAQNTNSARYTELPEYPGRTAPWAGFFVDGHDLYAWDTSGNLFGMGSNTRGQLGFGNTTAVHILTKLPGVSGVIDVVSSCGRDGVGATFVLTSTGQVFGAGYSGYGALGQGNTAQLTVFTEITGFGGNATGIACGNTRYSPLYIITDEVGNNLYGCGYNGRGQLGLGNTTQQLSVVSLGLGVTKLVVGDGYSSYVTAHALCKDGAIRSAGGNTHGCIGDGTATQRTSWTQFGSYTSYVDVGCCESYGGYTYGITATKELDVAGYNGHGAFGIGNTTQQNAVIRPALGYQGSVAKVAPTTQYASQGLTILTTTGEIWYSGYNSRGISGIGKTSGDISTAAIMPLPKGAVPVDAKISGYTTYTTMHVLCADGRLLVSGDNTYGQAANAHTGGCQLRLTEVVGG